MQSHAFSLDKADGVALITFDTPDETINKFSAGVRDELFRLLQVIREDPSVSAVVFRSGKPETFSAGADIHEFVALESQEEARRLSSEGQRMLAQVAAFPKPIVIAIGGACLGGGLEFSIAAHYRVASDDAKTQLGLPEVQLGILPAAGGCQRLPRLIGLRAALDIILTGRPVGAGQALQLGLIDELVPKSQLREAALAAAQRLVAGWRARRRGPGGVAALLLDRNPIGQRLVLRQARKRVLRRTGGHYPAPLAALEAVRYGLAHGMEAGLWREVELFGRLAVSEVSRNLIRLFFATRALERDLGAEVESDQVRTIGRLGIVGAGFMGAGIAGVAALNAEIDVRLRDLDEARVGAGILKAREFLDGRLERGRLTKDDHARILGLITGVVDDSGLADRDLVIEAVFEDVDVKRAVIFELERAIPDSCIVASNTSTISISRLQDGARRPERVVGSHFFSPVAKMPLLEIVRGERTADWVTATTVSFGRRLGKTVIVVRDAPGFWVNRILAPYLNEAGWLLAEGAAIEAIDSAMTRFGFPVGPITLLDEIGLDVAEKAAAVLYAALGERFAPAPAIAALGKEGRLGRKTGRGFFRYKKGKKRGGDAA
ncbi:MAG: 3-hydroxyacyl-CoA dehydrogenase NAD-binding domain-containing protein, partial [Gemmatimonadales bacterium]